MLFEIELTGINNGYIKKELFEEAYTSEIWFNGPLYSGTKLTRNKFRIDGGTRGRLVKQPKWELISSTYPETKRRFLVKTMDSRELLLEKIISMFNRNKGRDLYDVWFLLKSGLVIDKDLLKQKVPKGLDMDKYPTKTEYERDMNRLTNRVIPYKQVINEVDVELRRIR